jgi:hypothetical protein
VQAMTAAELHRLLLVCALASDLYCPGYNPKQSLAKNSNLARTAGRYKVDLAKVATNVRTELAKKKNTLAVTKGCHARPFGHHQLRHPLRSL